jgi:hypothetical protein
MWNGNSRGYWLVICQIQYSATVAQHHLPQKLPWSADSHSCMYVCGRQWPTGRQIGPENRVYTVRDMKRTMVWGEAVADWQANWPWKQGIYNTWYEAHNGLGWGSGRLAGKLALKTGYIQYVTWSAQWFGVRQWPTGRQIGPEDRVYTVRDMKRTMVWGEAVADWQANWPWKQGIYSTWYEAHNDLGWGSGQLAGKLALKTGYIQYVIWSAWRFFGWDGGQKVSNIVQKEDS